MAFAQITANTMVRLGPLPTPDIRLTGAPAVPFPSSAQSTQPFKETKLYEIIKKAEQAVKEAKTKTEEELTRLEQEYEETMKNIEPEPNEVQKAGIGGGSMLIFAFFGIGIFLTILDAVINK